MMEQFSNFKIRELNSSLSEKYYLVISKNNYFEANQIMVELLLCLQKSKEIREGINIFLANHKDLNYSYDQINEIIQSKIIPIFCIEKTVSKSQFLYDKQLLSPAIIDKVSTLFRFLFVRKILISVMMFTIIVDVLFWLYAPNLLVYNNGITLVTIILLIFLILFSSLVHELGHASACKYFGIQHGGIGIGFYLNFPVLYTDVTNIWQLSRGKRCIVNIAGVYFQSILLVVLIFGYLICRSDLLRYMIFMMNIGFLLTLNPFFKFDGYWLASDLLGIPNLHLHSKEMIKYFLYKIIRKKSSIKLKLAKVKLKEKVAFVIYVFMVNVFMVYYFCYIIPKFICRFIKSFPEEMQQLVSYLTYQIVPPFALVRNIFSQLLFCVLIIYMIISFGKNFIIKKFVKK